MGIDTSMYSGMMQKPKSIAEYDADRLQLQQAQQQNRLADLVYGEKQREISGDNALASLLSGGKTGADVSQGLAAAGYGNKALAYTKTLQEQEKQKADILKTKAEAGYKDIEAAQKRIDTAGQAFGFVRTNPTAENAYAAIDHLARNGVYTEQEAAAHKAVVAADSSPTKIAQLADMAFRAALAAKEQLAKTDTRNLGGTTETISIDPVTGKTATINKATNTQSPDNAATNATSRANNAATVGASYANAAATREIAKATRDSASIQRDQATEMKLADDYRAQSKDFKAVGDAYRQISSTLDKATTSPAATLAAATKFMKLLDPGSVVRESELGMALAATGVFDRATNYFNTLQSGKVLTKNQVADFKNITQQIYKAAQDGQKQIDSSYTQQAKTYKLRPEMIVQDLGQNTPAIAPAGTKAPVIPSGWSVKEH